MQCLQNTGNVHFHSYREEREFQSEHEYLVSEAVPENSALSWQSSYSHGCGFEITGQTQCSEKWFYDCLILSQRCLSEAGAALSSQWDSNTVGKNCQKQAFRNHGSAGSDSLCLRYSFLLKGLFSFYLKGKVTERVRKQEKKEGREGRR